MLPPPSASFLKDHEGAFWLSCSGCKREAANCGTNRNKLPIEARTRGYKLVPGLGWICRDCYWATEIEVTISGSIETNPS